MKHAYSWYIKVNASNFMTQHSSATVEHTSVPMSCHGSDTLQEPFSYKGSDGTRSPPPCSCPSCRRSTISSAATNAHAPSKTISEPNKSLATTIIQG